MSIPVAPFMQNLTNPRVRAKLQTNFMDFVLIPWWRSFIRFFPSLDHCNKRLLTNRGFFDEVARGLQDENLLSSTSFPFIPTAESPTHSGQASPTNPHK